MERNEIPTSLKGFSRLKVIGRGAHGVCSLYRDTGNNRKLVVIKTVSLECRSKDEIKVILRNPHLLIKTNLESRISYEAQLLGQLSHPNIIRLYKSCHNLQTLFIVMEYADGGTLDGMIKEREGDFGISKELSSRDIASTVIGTPHYLSPEICEGRTYDLKSKAFEGESFPSIVLRITRGKYGAISPTVSVDMRQLISSLLEMDDKRRPATKGKK